MNVEQVYVCIHVCMYVCVCVCLWVNQLWEVQVDGFQDEAAVARVEKYGACCWHEGVWELSYVQEGRRFVLWISSHSCVFVLISFLGRIVYTQCIDAACCATDVACSVVCMSLCLSVLVEQMCCAKTRCRLGADSYRPSEPCIRRWGRDPPRERAILGVVQPIEKHWESLLWYMHQQGSFSPQ